MSSSRPVFPLSRWLATALVVCLSCSSFLSLAQQEQLSDSGTSELAGKLLDAAGKPIQGGTVLAYHLSSEQVFRSNPTGPNGTYEIVGMPYGYFDLSVEMGPPNPGLLVGRQVVNLPPATKVVVVLTFDANIDPSDLRSFPGSEAQPIGGLTVQEKLTGRAFWQSAKGIGIIAGAGGAILLAVAAGGGDSDPFVESSPSPSTP